MNFFRERGDTIKATVRQRRYGGGRQYCRQVKRARIVERACGDESCPSGVSRYIGSREPDEYKITAVMTAQRTVLARAVNRMPRKLMSVIPAENRRTQPK